MPHLVELADALVLVTGGAGFIGSHLVEGLLAQGAKVRVLDNFSSGTRENIRDVSGQIETIQGDIRDLETCIQATAGVDALLHDAACVSIQKSFTEPTLTMATNVLGTANMFQAAHLAKVRRVVYASSASIYGTHSTSANTEDCVGNELSPYALSKRMTEQLAAMYCRCFGMDIIGLRYFNVYGPRQSPHGGHASVVPRFFGLGLSGEPVTVYGTGEQSRDFVYVSDVVQANLSALTNERVEATVYNVGTGTGTSINELAARITSLTGGPGPLACADQRADDATFSLADTRRFAKVFGYVPRTSVWDGLKMTLQFYLAGYPPLRAGDRNE